MSCKSSVSKIAAEFSPFVFLPLSTRAYFKGRAYIKVILKNHARSYFAGRSYYRGNTVAVAIHLEQKVFETHLNVFIVLALSKFLSISIKINFE